MIVALLGFLGLLVLLVVGVLTAIGGSGADRDDVPDGLADITVEASRADDRLILAVRGDPADDSVVSVCPGLLPGPSDAAGMLERIRVSGCITAARDTAAGPDVWALSLGDLGDEQTVAFDAAERWLMVIVDPSAAGSDDAVAGAWIAGGPLLPTGPLLP